MLSVQTVARLFAGLQGIDSKYFGAAYLLAKAEFLAGATLDAAIATARKMYEEEQNDNT